MARTGYQAKPQVSSEHLSAESERYYDSSFSFDILDMSDDQDVMVVDLSDECEVDDVAFKVEEGLLKSETKADGSNEGHSTGTLASEVVSPLSVERPDQLSGHQDPRWMDDDEAFPTHTVDHGTCVTLFDPQPSPPQPLDPALESRLSEPGSILRRNGKDFVVACTQTHERRRRSRLGNKSSEGSLMSCDISLSSSSFESPASSANADDEDMRQGRRRRRLHGANRERKRHREGQQRKRQRRSSVAGTPSKKGQKTTPVRTLPQLYQKDVFFHTSMSQDPLAEYVWKTPLLAARLGLRAVYTKDMELLRRLAPPATPALIIPQSVDRPDRTVLHAAVLAGDEAALIEIFRQEESCNAQQNRKERPDFPVCAIAEHQPGQLSSKTYGAYIDPASIGVARGGRQGDHAFARDLHVYQNRPEYFLSSLQIVVGQLIVQDVPRDKLQMFINMCRTFPEYHSSWCLTLGLAARLGRADLCRYILQEALAVGGYAVSPFHLDVLRVGQDPEPVEATLVIADADDTEEPEAASDTTTVAANRLFPIETTQVAGATVEETLLKRYRKVTYTKKAYQNYRISPFHLAAVNPSTTTTMFKALVEALGNLPAREIVDLHGWTALHYAAANRSTHILQYLIEEKEWFVHMRDLRGITPLMVAAYAGNLDAVQYLVSKGADPSQKALARIPKKAGHSAGGEERDPFSDMSGADALHMAVQRGHVHVVNWLLSSPLVPSPRRLLSVVARSTKGTVLHDASALGRVEVLQCLLTHGGSLNKRDRQRRTPLMMAAMNGCLDVVRVLVEAGADIDTWDSSGNTAFHYACAYGWIHVAHLLVAAGVNVNAMNDWKTAPISIALLKCHYGLVEWLIRETPSLNTNIEDGSGLTLLHHFCAQKITSDTLDMIMRLIERGADVNQKDQAGRTPLHVLLENTSNRPLRADDIISAEAPTSLETDDDKQLDAQRSPPSPSPSLGSEHAVEGIDSVVVAEELCCTFNNQRGEEGSESTYVGPTTSENDLDHSSSTSCHATVHRHQEPLARPKVAMSNNAVLTPEETLLELLVQHGADVNARTNTGETLLSHAIKNKAQPLVLKLLHTARVDHRVEDCSGRNVLHLFATSNASEEDYMRFLEALLSARGESFLRDLGAVGDYCGFTPLLLLVNRFCWMHCGEVHDYFWNDQREECVRDRIALEARFVDLVAKLVDVTGANLYEALLPRRMLPATLNCKETQSHHDCDRHYWFHDKRQFWRHRFGADESANESTDDERSDTTANTTEQFGGNETDGDTSNHNDVSNKVQAGDVEDDVAVKLASLKNTLEHAVREDRRAADVYEDERQALAHVLYDSWASVTRLRPLDTSHIVLPEFRRREPSRLRYDWFFGRFTPVHYFVQANLPNEIQLWTKLGRDKATRLQVPLLSVEQLQDIHGVTPLMLAVAASQTYTPQIVRSVLAWEKAMGISTVNARKFDGSTVGHIAVATRQHSLVKELFSLGYQWRIGDMFGRTICHLAAFLHDLTMVELLTEQGVDWTLPDDFGRTALHWCLNSTETSPAFDVEEVIIQAILAGKTSESSSLTLGTARAEANSDDVQTTTAAKTVPDALAEVIRRQDFRHRTVLHDCFLPSGRGVNRLRVRLPPQDLCWKITRTFGGEVSRTSIDTVALARIKNRRLRCLSMRLKQSRIVAVNETPFLDVQHDPTRFEERWRTVTGTAFEEESVSKSQKAKQKPRMFQRRNATNMIQRQLAPDEDVPSSRHVVTLTRQRDSGRHKLCDFTSTLVDIEFLLNRNEENEEQMRRDPVGASMRFCGLSAAPVNVRDVCGLSCLGAAASVGATISSLTLLQKCGCDLLETDKDGNTPFARALLFGHFDLGVIFILRHANVHDRLYVPLALPPSPTEVSAFYQCVKMRHYDTAYLLLQHGFPLIEALQDTLRLKHFQFALSLAQKIPDPKALQETLPDTGETLLHLICQTNDEKDDVSIRRLVTLLLHAGVDPSIATRQRQSTVLHLAVRRRHETVLSAVLDLPSAWTLTRMKDADGWIPLCYALLPPRKNGATPADEENKLWRNTFSNPQTLEYLQKLVPQKDATVLDRDLLSQQFVVDADAALTYLDRVTLAAQKNGLWNLEDYKSTILIEAIKLADRFHLPYLENLLHDSDGGGVTDASIPDSLGLTPLTWAIKRNFATGVALLLQNIHEPWWALQDTYGWSPLDYAVTPFGWGTFDNSIIVEQLLVAGSASSSALNALDHQVSSTMEKVEKLKVQRRMVARALSLAEQQGAVRSVAVIKQHFPKVMADSNTTGLQNAIPSVVSAPNDHTSNPTDTGLPPRVSFAADAEAFIQNSSLSSSMTRQIRPPPVHPGFQNSQYCKDGTVVIEDDIVYDVLLTKVDIVKGEQGESKMYGIQLVHERTKNVYFVVTTWGGMAENPMYQATPAADLQAAKKLFAKIFREKTGNDWENRQTFLKKPKKYGLLSIDRRRIEYSSVETFDVGKAAMSGDSPPCTLPASLVNLLTVLTDPLLYVHSVDTYPIDQHRIPLTRLSGTVLQKANDILEELLVHVNVLDKLQWDRIPANRPRLIETIGLLARLSSEYYELIPQTTSDAAFLKPFHCAKDIEYQMRLLKDLSDSHLYMKIMLGAALRRDTIHPLDYCLRALPVTLIPLPFDSLECSFLLNYYNVTRDGALDEISCIYQVSRDPEVHNPKFTATSKESLLLWHGTRPWNVFGILNSGLRAAPGTAEFHGAAFGRGIYLADAAAKSLNYSENDSVNGEEQTLPKYMFLCEVVLGMTMVTIFPHDDPQARLRKVFGTEGAIREDSYMFFAPGKRGPDWKKALRSPDSVWIPVTSCENLDETSLAQLHPPHHFRVHELFSYNEYIVPFTEHVRLRYLVEFNNAKNMTRS